jgi:hypothetical protein
MRDISQETLEASRPDKSAAECVDFCLRQLFQDRTHTIDQTVAGVLTYEELIGALLLAQDKFVEDDAFIFYHEAE